MKELIYKPVRAARLEDLDPNTQDRIAQSIVTKYVDWRTLRRGYEEVWAEIDRHVNQYDPAYTPQEGYDRVNRTNNQGGFGSKLKMTNVYSHREGLVSAVMKYQFANDYDFFDIDPLDALDDQKTETIKEYLLWLFDKMDFENDFTPFVRDWVQYGTAIASYEWNKETVTRWRRSYAQDPTTGQMASMDTEAQEIIYDAPKLTPLNLQYAVIDPVAPNIKTATLIYQRPATAHDIMANTAYHNLNWDDVNKAPDFGSNSYFPREMERELTRRNYAFSTTMAYKGQKEVTEAWGDFADGQDLYKNYVAEILDGKLIRFEPNPYDMPHKPFIIARYTQETNRVYGPSPLATITGIQAGMDTMMNQYIDYWTMRIQRPLLVEANAIVRSAKEDKSKLPPMSMHAAWTVRSRDGVGRMPDDMGATSMDPSSMYGILEAQMERATGDNSLNSGGTPQPYMKTGVAMQAADAGSARLNMYAKTLEREAVIPFLGMTLDLVRQMNVPQKTFNRQDDPNQELTFNVAMLANDIKFSMRGASFNMSKQVQTTALQQFLTMLASSPVVTPLVNWIKAIKIMGEALNIRHIDELIAPQAMQQLAMMPQTQPTFMQRVQGLFTGQQGNPAIIEDNSNGQQSSLGLAAAGGGTTPGTNATPGQVSPFDNLSQR